MSEKASANPGLTTEEGLLKLHKDIEKLVNEYDVKFNQKTWRLFLSFLHGKGSCYSFLSALYVAVTAILLLVCAFMMGEERCASGSSSWFILEALILLASIVLNLAVLVLKVEKVRGKQIGLKRQILAEIQDLVVSNLWTECCYPDLYSPLSPCVSLQWCKRDGKIINLPVALLVEGDIIVMRPGRPSPGRCKSLQSDKILNPHEVYTSEMPSHKGSGPQPRTPLTTELFVIEETPILKNLRLSLTQEERAPMSLIESECHDVCFLWLEQRIIPALLVIMFVLNATRYFYLDPDGAHWTEILIVLQIQGVLPLVSIISPVLWVTVNTFGQAHILAAFDVCRTMHDSSEEVDSLSSCSNISVQEAHVSITWKETLSGFVSMMFATKPITCPDFEMLHTLGSVTAFCCVDKKGVLSWPNPSAEKICFFSSTPKHSVSQPEPQKGKGTRRKMRSQPDIDPSSNVEVLDLTHETAKDVMGIVFDDHQWKDHMAALKPLGLAILLNTCNTHTADWYSQFSDHVSCTSRESQDTVAVVNRRCMCQLSKEIGFTKEAVSVFSHEATLGVYRQVPVEDSEKEKHNRARSFNQHKIPMPYQVSVLVRDKLTGMCQLMTQGTGDIVLDCCSDAWTGTDLMVLSEIDRKKVLDFYHRNSMVAYCTAFAYKPIPKALEDCPSDVYTELVESPNATKQAHGEDMGVFLDQDEGDFVYRQRSHSMDSLLEVSPTCSMEDVGVGQMMQSHQTFIGMVSLQYQARQGFIQLIDKLESACIRFVHFSEENEVRSRVFSEKLGLEAGWNCHVSLIPTESGASTHSSCKNLANIGNTQAAGNEPLIEGAEGIPLQSREGTSSSLTVSSPSTVPRTHSAPSFVNTEEVQVKFAKDPLPIVIDQEEDSRLSGPLTYATSAVEDDDDADESTVLIHSLSKHNKNSSREVDERRCEVRLEEESEHFSRQYEKRPLGACKGTKCWEEIGEDFQNEEEEDLDLQSDSRYTSSYITENTEDSLAGAFDNRAHLPRGIENIRPHLQNVDNVPLLVNLFTDCTSEATCDMVEIMQENGEVVLVLGSSLNMANTPVFLQADCSIAVEPLFPQLCVNRPVISCANSTDSTHPTQLASRLLSLPSPLVFQRKDSMKLIQLFMEARHFLFALRNCFYLMLCCFLAVALAQLLCCLLLLPPAMAVQHVLWLVLVVIPALGLSLMGNPDEERTMCMATHKNTHHINLQVIVEFLVQFSTRFVPSIAVALYCYAFVLHSFCETVEGGQCSLFQFEPSPNGTIGALWTEKFQGGLVLAQNIFHLFFVIFLVAISMSLVHWQDHLWQRLPFKNLAWSATAASILLLQIVFSVSDTYCRHTWFGRPMPMSEVHLSVWLLGFCWPLVTIALNELAKKREIKLAVRRQRRARLDFDTKLGMNSPF